MADQELIEIMVAAGQTDRPTLLFTPGTPANTVGVGASGQWRIAAPGVAPVHFYMVFDGRDVHVASATPTGQVLVAGMLAGPAWTRAPIPCEIRFGGASLFLRAISRPKEDDEATMHDGGALWQAAQRAVQDAAARGAGPSAPPPPQDEKTQVTAFPPVRPAAGQAPPQPGSLPPVAAPAPPAPVDFSKTTPLANPQELQMAVAAARAAAPPPTFEPSPNTVRAPLAAPAVPPTPPPSDGLLEATVIGPPPVGYRVPSAPPPNAQPAQPPSSPPAANPTTSPGTAKLDAPAKPSKPSYWQEASPVKKATLILMPFALVLSYFMLLPDAPPPRPTATSAAQKRAATARDAGSIARADAAAPIAAPVIVDAGALANAGDDDDDDDETAAPATSAVKNAGNPVADAGGSKGASKKTPERAALDAVAAGTLDEALRDYTALAALHPDDPNFKEAVRVLRLKTGHPE